MNSNASSFSKPYPIVIVDDHKMFREMLETMFRDHEDFTVNGTAANLSQALDIIAATHPAIVLLDINLQQESGIDAIAPILKVSPATKIIILSMHGHPAYAQKAIKGGAHGYITKNSSHKDIFTAIEEVMNNKMFICTEIKESLAELMLSNDVPDTDQHILSSREKQVVQYIREGLTSKEIAPLLGISLKTVEVHRYNIFRKLKVKNSASLVSKLSYSNIR